MKIIVTLARTVWIPAYNEAHLPVHTPPKYNNQEVLLEQPPHALSVSIARALAFCKNNKAVCCILNTNPYVVTLKTGLKLAKIAGLVDTIASMRLCQPPLSSSSSSSVIHNEVTDMGVARSQVADRGMAKHSQPVNHSRHDLDNFHAEYGFKLSPQLDDAQRYEILEMLLHYKSFLCAI